MHLLSGHGWGYRFGSGCVGDPNNSQTNAFAHWVMTEVTDLDRGVLGTLDVSPANVVAYWMSDGVTDSNQGVSVISNNSPEAAVAD